MGGRSGQSIIRNTEKKYNANVTTVNQNNFNNYTQNDILSFAGVPEEYTGKVRISYREYGAIVSLRGDGIEMDRRIDLNNMSVQNMLFTIDNDSPYKGKGTEIFNNQVKSLKKAGFNEITTQAAGSKNSEYNGYYTWARLGFEPENKQLGVDSFNEFAKNNGLSKVNSFNEIMSTSKGREYWKNNGNEFIGKFSLKNNSYSLNTLNSYINEKK